MNRALLNPFEAADLPRGIEEVLEQDSGTCMRFNRHGNLLAVGTRTGQVFLWDFDTLSIACVLGETSISSHPVICVSFPAPRNGSMVMVAFASGLLRLYDTLSRSIVSEIAFDIPIVQAISHPKISQIAIVVLKNSHPLILHLRRGVYEAKAAQFQPVHNPNQLILFKAAEQQRDVPGIATPHRMPPRPATAFGNRKMAAVPDKQPSIPCTVLCTPDEFQDGVPKESSASRRKSPYCVVFTRGGQYILRGGQTGLVRAFELNKDSSSSHSYPVASCCSVVAVPGKAPVRSIQLSRKGSNVLINSQDRIMRLFFLDQILNPPEARSSSPPTMHLNTTFAELVNKTQCQSACFSRDGDFVLGGMEGTDHRIHVWRAADGFLDLSLEGPREGIVEILWHPMRPVMASLSTGGYVYVWMKNFTENWSAFAAEFNELEANEEYVEAEDEFDLKEPEDEERRVEQRERQEAKDVNIDVCDQLGWFSSDSDEGDTFFYVPAVPAPDSDIQYDSVADRIIAKKVREEKSAREVEAPRTDGQNGRNDTGSSKDGRRKKRGADASEAPKPHKLKRSKNGSKKKGREANGDRNSRRIVDEPKSKDPSPPRASDGGGVAVVSSGVITDEEDVGLVIASKQTEVTDHEMDESSGVVEDILLAEGTENVGDNDDEDSAGDGLEICN